MKSEYVMQKSQHMSEYVMQKILWELKTDFHIFESRHSVDVENRGAPAHWTDSGYDSGNFHINCKQLYVLVQTHVQHMFIILVW